jgi:putative ABC transport system permease protein
MIAMVGPILRALARRSSAAILVVLEVAFGLTIVVQALVFSRYFRDVADHPSRIDPGVFVVTAHLAAPDDVDLAALRARDLAALRALPGVRAATVVARVPQSRWVGSYATELDGRVEQSYALDGTDLREVLGVPLVAGRDLEPADALVPPPQPTPILVDAALAADLGGDVLGRTVTLHARPNPGRVVGVVASFSGLTAISPEADHMLIVPDPTPLSRTEYYLVRPAAAGPAAEAAAAAAIAALRAVEPRRLLTANRLDELRASIDRSARGGIVVFDFMVLAVALMAILGSLGMSSFLVAERVKQIGTRRALGATRGAIVRHFLVENWLITSAGLLLGAPLAVALNTYARRTQPELLLDVGIFAGAAVLFWIANLCAALLPALRAAAVPPSAATRTV